MLTSAIATTNQRVCHQRSGLPLVDRRRIVALHRRGLGPAGGRRQAVDAVNGEPVVFEDAMQPPRPLPRDPGRRPAAAGEIVDSPALREGAGLQAGAVGDPDRDAVAPSCCDGTARPGMRGALRQSPTRPGRWVASNPPAAGGRARPARPGSRNFPYRRRWRPAETACRQQRIEDARRHQPGRGQRGAAARPGCSDQQCERGRREQRAGGRAAQLPRR